MFITHSKAKDHGYQSRQQYRVINKDSGLELLSGREGLDEILGYGFDKDPEVRVFQMYYLRGFPALWVEMFNDR